MYKGKLDQNDYRFFYNKYTVYKNEQNKNKKDSCDNSLRQIHRVLGKASIRDSKIDDILNG